LLWFACRNKFPKGAVRQLGALWMAKAPNGRYLPI